ncbi:PASTA domain-containing protein [Bacteroidota bacterium]
MRLLKFIFSWLFIKNLFLALLYSLIILIVTMLSIRVYTHHGKSKPIPDLSNLTLEEVAAICKKEKLRFEITDSVYVNYKKRGTVIDQNPDPGFRAKKNRRIFLTINAFQPEIVEMPNVVGFSYRQAKAILETKGLSIGEISYESDLALNNVLEQKINGEEIEEGTNILKGTDIDLVLGNGYARRYYYTPYLIGKKLEEAKRELHDLYFNIGKIEYDSTVLNYPDSMNASIFKQSPGYKKDDSKPAATHFDLWLTLDTAKISFYDTLSTTIN